MLGNYSNNHLGLRVEKEAKDPLQPNAPPAIFRTLWNGRHAFQDSDLSGNTLSRYENDGRHTVSFWSSTDGSQALHHDALGSITATTDNSGQLKSETVYDAFGNVVSQVGLSANKFGYTGHQMDQETGLIYFQARYYDPQTGRFITQDPYEGDWNTPLPLHHYLYAYGNPTTYIDLDGYQSRKPYHVSVDPVTGQKTFSDRPPAPNTDQQAANHNAREQERARRTLADKTRPLNNFDDPEFIQRRLTREAAHKPGIGGDEVEELPSQIQLRQMHARGKLAAQIGGEIVEVATPTPETIIAGPLVGGILNKAKPLLPFLKEAAKDVLKAKKTEQTVAKIESAELKVTVKKEGDVSEKISSNGTGIYDDVKGHHIHAKAGFKGHVNYDADEGFSISQQYMKDRGWDHDEMTRTQRILFKELEKSGRANTMKEHSRIAVQALIDGGATRQEARNLVAESLKKLRSDDVRTPSGIPWQRK